MRKDKEGVNMMMDDRGNDREVCSEKLAEEKMKCREIDQIQRFQRKGVIRKGLELSEKQ